jgi:glucose-6-phosphate isomerase
VEPFLSLAFGPETFTELLAGAHEADILAEEPRVNKNPSLMDAAIGMYYRNILQYPMIAVLPYSQALRRFPAHLQQLDMESNGGGKRRTDAESTSPTGPDPSYSESLVPWAALLLSAPPPGERYRADGFIPLPGISGELGL